MEHNMPEQPHLLVFGPGYSAEPLMQQALKSGWKVSATWRRPEAKPELQTLGITPVEFGADSNLPDGITHCLVSVAPRPEGDPVLVAFGDQLRNMKTLRWVGYLSSTNVYGDHQGAWVDETSSAQPSLERGKRRLLAEDAWTQLGVAIGAAVHVFRLAGIYGPGKNAIRSVLDGKARRVVKPGQVFGRIHRDDIADALWRAAQSGLPSNVFNLADNLPSPPQDVIEEAARLLGVNPPPEVPLDEADLSPMGRSFYAENKRVRNRKAKDLLGWTPAWPDYHYALAKLLKEETGG